MASAKTKKPARNAFPTRETLEERGWEEVGNEPIEKWEKGKKLIGRFVKMRHGQFGPLLVLDTDDGTVIAGCPKILESRMEGVQPGDMVYVECIGDVTTSSGRTAHGFTVMRKRSGAVTDRSQETLPI